MDAGLTGIENNNIVLLKRTSPGLFHGHLATWSDIDQSIRTVLIKKKLTTPSGKIIKYITKKSLT